MLISPAYAQAAPTAMGGLDPAYAQLLMLVLIFVVFYVLLIRPQQKRAKQHKEMIGALRRGDQVITSGGIKGKVAKVADDEIQVEIADGVRIRVVRDTIQTVLARGEPAKDDDDDKDGDKKKSA